MLQSVKSFFFKFKKALKATKIASEVKLFLLVTIIKKYFSIKQKEVDDV